MNNKYDHATIDYDLDDVPLQHPADFGADRDQLILSNLEYISKRLAKQEDVIKSIIIKLDLITSSFIHNDLGRPDYDGHRKEHLSLAQTKKTLEGYKEDSAKKILGVIITVILFLILGGFGQWIKTVVLK